MADLLAIGTIARPHGIRGAVRVICGPEYAAFLRTRPVVHVAGTRRRVESVGGTDANLLVTFEGITNRNLAEELRNVQVEVPRSELPAPEEDEFFHGDLVGCRVVDQAGTEVGTVSQVHSYPANDVLTVGKVLIPFTTDAVTDVDMEQRVLTVDSEFLGL